MRDSPEPLNTTGNLRFVKASFLKSGSARAM